MKCSDAVNQLSLFVDEMLPSEKALEVSRHLAGCPRCRDRYAQLARIQEGLRSLERVSAPDYFGDLVRKRIAGAQETRWTASLRSDLGYYWSRIRTAEATWFWTRALGTVCAFSFFFFIYASMNQLHVQMQPGLSERGSISKSESFEVVRGVLRNLGITPTDVQKRPVSITDAKINDLYLLDFGENSLGAARDGTFSVVAMVDRMGAARIQNVLDYPADERLLTAFNDMLRTARCRPAQHNGQPVDSLLLMTFSKISVHD